MKTASHFFKFLLSRVLWRSRLVRLLRITIDRRLYKVSFSATAMSTSLWLNPDIERSEENFCKSYLKSGDIVVDVGANIGLLTLTAAAIVGPAGKVFSVEPHPTVFKALQKNVVLNNFNHVRLFNVAVGAQKEIAFFSNKRSDVMNRILSESSMLKVQVERLDDLLSPYNLERIGFMKVDTEGYEKFVFLGAPEILKKTQCILFECKDRLFSSYGYTSADVLKSVTSSGFDLYKMRNLGSDLLAIRDLGAFSERVGNLDTLQKIETS